MILDLLALVMARSLTKPVQRQEEETIEAVNNLIMVVDDSVTVRKVTGRLLLRNGFEVISARDGVEAMASLQEHRPALILLDIEMPRMDGYEVATTIRNDSKLHDIPIIMITSRTGEKHRQRAIDIGVDDYMGKPYQENLLMQRISELTTNVDE